MKKLLLFGLLSYVFAATSCGTVIEEIYLNEDGSGEYSTYADMIPMLQGMAMMMSSMDTTSTGEDPMDAIWADFPEGDIDSTYQYKDDLEGYSNKEVKLIQQAEGFMEGGRDKGFLNTGVRFKFNTLQELIDFNELMQKDESSDAAMMLSGTDSEASYKMSKKKFSRTWTFAEPEETNAEDEGMMNMMFGETKVQTIVHLPKNVKSVKGDNIVSQDGKKVVFEYKLLDLLSGDANGDFEIKMKKK